MKIIKLHVDPLGEAVLFGSVDSITQIVDEKEGVTVGLTKGDAIMIVDNGITLGFVDPKDNSFNEYDCVYYDITQDSFSCKKEQ